MARDASPVGLAVVPVVVVVGGGVDLVVGAAPAALVPVVDVVDC